MHTFNRKRPGELVVLTFDFCADLPEGVTLTGADPVSIAVARGADPSPAALLLDAPVLSGAAVLQRVQGGVLGTDYLIVARVTRSDGQIREMPALLPVRNTV